MTILNSKPFIRRLIVLATALLLVWVGISCKSKNIPGGEDSWGLSKPGEKTDPVGGDDGMIVNPSEMEKFTNEMIHIRHIAESGDGVAYYRNPVITTFGSSGKKKMAMFFEKRYGDGGHDDVGVDGVAKVDIFYLLSPDGGNTLDYAEGSGRLVGATSAQEDAAYSKGAPVVFTDGDTVTVIAASGGGYGRMNGGRYENPGSEIKLAKGTASGKVINFNDWEELNIEYTPDGASEALKGSEAIRKYVQDKVGSGFNALYLSQHQGKTSGNKWVLPVIIIDLNLNGNGLRKGLYGVLLLYSENKGTDWKFGQAATFGGDAGQYLPSSRFRESLALFTTDTEATIAARPFNHYRGSGALPLGIVTLSLQENQAVKGFGDIKTPGIVDSEGGTEMTKIEKAENQSMGGYYLINTRDRQGLQYNKNLTITITTDAVATGKDMFMSQTSGTGSAAVLEDGTIVTVAEEAFVEGSPKSRTQFNIVQRRFTHKYLETHSEINEDEQYINR